jgi:hypothetical protein
LPAATIGPTVWDEEGPIPILNNSASLTGSDGSIALCVDRRTSGGAHVLDDIRNPTLIDVIGYRRFSDSPLRQPQSVSAGLVVAPVRADRIAA